MPTDWNGRFRKLYEHPATSFRRLPLKTRGLASEVLRACRAPDGWVCDGYDAADVGLLVHAHPSELADVSEGVEALVAQGFLEQRDGGLWVANFGDMWESYETKRKREYRRRVAENVPDSPPDVPPEERRGEERRSDKRRSDPPKAPKGGRRTRRKNRTQIPEDWTPSEAVFQWAIKEHRCSRIQIEGLVPDFVDWWRSTGETKADWNATFRSRIRRWVKDGRLVPDPDADARKQRSAEYRSRQEAAEGNPGGKVPPESEAVTDADSASKQAQTRRLSGDLFQ